MPKIGVVLSGCGVNDGAEIHESVLTLLALDRAGAETLLMAPNISQMHVINHFTGEEMDETRNVLVESARIARGNIVDMQEVNGKDIDALIFPGGFGVAKNLCNYALAGSECEVHPHVIRLVKQVRLLHKPIGVICIAPVMMAKILSKEDRTDLTIGYDEKTGNDITAMGSNHIRCSVTDIIVDQKQKIVSTPAYMEAKSIKEAAEGIEKLVDKILSMI